MCNEREDGLYGLRVCWRSREVDESDELLHYLRERQKGQEPTSLTIYVYARTATSFVMVEGAEVVAVPMASSGAERTMKAT